MKSRFSAPPGADIVYFAPKLNKEFNILAIDGVSASIQLPDDSRLTIFRKESEIDVIREKE